MISDKISSQVLSLSKVINSTQKHHLLSSCHERQRTKWHEDCLRQAEPEEAISIRERENPADHPQAMSAQVGQV